MQSVSYELTGQPKIWTTRGWRSAAEAQAEEEAKKDAAAIAEEEKEAELARGGEEEGRSEAIEPVEAEKADDGRAGEEPEVALDDVLDGLVRRENAAALSLSPHKALAVRKLLHRSGANVSDDCEASPKRPRPITHTTR